jgi:hypothetical protein
MAKQRITERERERETQQLHGQESGDKHVAIHSTHHRTKSDKKGIRCLAKN